MQFKLRLSHKIQASTLVETIVAMLIITITFSMAFLIILNISKNSNNSLRTKAYFATSNVMVQTVSEKEYYDQDFTFGNITVKRIVSEYEKYDELFQINYSAYNSRNQKLFEQNELIIIEKSK